MPNKCAAHMDLGPLDRVEEHFHEQTRTGQIPGIVALVTRNGEVARAVVTGWRDQERTVAMSRDTLFRIASMTKPITTVAALILIEDGRLDLNAPIDRWLPRFARQKVMQDPFGSMDRVDDAIRSITLLDLLTHRSGLAYSTTLAGPLGQALTRASLFTDNTDGMEQWITDLAVLPLAWQPGTRFHYGLSSDVLGILIERVAGMPLLDFLKIRIFGPLGMSDTSFFVAPEKQHRLATAFRQEEDGSIGIFDRSESSLWTNPKRFQGGGGGLISTADDYLQFAEMLLGRGKLRGVRIMSPRSVALMTVDWLTTEQRAHEAFGQAFFAGQGYGLGVSVTDKPAFQQQQVGYSSSGSFGWNGVYGTCWRADPTEKMNLIYMSQLISRDMTAAQSATLADAAYDAIDD